MTVFGLSLQDAIATLFLFGGAFFLVVSSVGLLRLPDFYSRSHAVGKSETLGSILLLGGLALHNGFGLESAKLGLIVIFVAATNPSGIHVLTRAALRKGIAPWIHPDDREEAQRRAEGHITAVKAEIEAEADGPGEGAPRRDPAGVGINRANTSGDASTDRGGAS